MQSHSETTALEFYEQLGMAGLSERANTDRDTEIVARLQEQLPPSARILDLGCGYGRIAVPLACVGHRVVALDLCRRLLREGQHESREASRSPWWLGGTMSSLPLCDNSLDVALCLWTAFFELIERQEQIRTLVEVLRALRPDGWALFEGPCYREATPSEIASGDRSGRGNRIFSFRVGAATNSLYCHDEASLGAIARSAGIESFSVYTDAWAGRERLFLRFEKRYRWRQPDEGLQTTTDSWAFPSSVAFRRRAAAAWR